jgi:hypothetical protein
MHHTQPSEAQTRLNLQQQEMQYKQATDTTTQAFTVHQSQQQHPQTDQNNQVQHNGQIQEHPMQIEQLTDLQINQSLQDQMLTQSLTHQYWQGVQQLSQQQSIQATLL